MKDPAVAEIILQAYSSAHEPAAWAEVLNRLTERYNANGVIIWEWSGHGVSRILRPVMFSSYYRREALEDYIKRHQKSEFSDQLEFEQMSLQYGHLAPDRVDLVSEQDLYPVEDEYLAAPHVKEMLSHGIRHRYGALLDRDNPFRSRFSLQTSEERGHLAPEEVAELAAVLPHLAKSMELSNALNAYKSEHAVFLKAFDRLNVGICILDAGSRVVAKNEEFNRQLNEFDAFWLSRDARLVLHDQADRGRFDDLLQDFRNHGAFGARPRKEAILVNTRGKAGALCLELLPPTDLLEEGTTHNHLAVLISRDTSLPIQVDVKSAKNAFQLTGAEAQVLELVCSGLTNPAIAEQRDRSVETINAQVKTVLGKTGTANRTQLVRLMCNFPQVI
ncbi:helix-turn-helix transcriptional regulator [Ruegeria atlantica]|uniref:helix-turn-helix transcriptional regulator n=1 Tax=Ruegeria atlantica TaxID=81569 RepID=UPI00147CAE84|nr:helix-turn-helix transcriptional regulator [Ruegeria atlantica]